MILNVVISGASVLLEWNVWIILRSQWLAHSVLVLLQIILRKKCVMYVFYFIILLIVFSQAEWHLQDESWLKH